MTKPERSLSRVVGDGTAKPGETHYTAALHAANAPTQELSVDHFRRDMFDAAMQGLVDTLDRLYYLRMLIQSSVSYGGELERVIGLNDLDTPIKVVRTLAERVQDQQDALDGRPFQLTDGSGNE